MLLFTAGLTRQGKNTGIGMQQPSAVKLVQSRKQLAHCQVA
jgi:hypothetical protein